MRKQANGKWVEVSDKGMTKEEHSKKINELSSKAGEKMGYAFHSKQASKLSDKEYDESELEGDLVDKVASHYNVSREKVSKLKLDGTDTPLELSRALGLHLNDTNFSGVNDTIKKLSGKNKDLENKLSELIDKENFYEKVAEHFGEPDDDGESESALIDRILSHGEEKVKKFIDSLK